MPKKNGPSTASSAPEMSGCSVRESSLKRRRSSSGSDDASRMKSKASGGGAGAAGCTTPLKVLSSDVELIFAAVSVVIAQSGGGACFAVTMRDFVGTEHLEAKAKAELLQFNYDLAVGDDEKARATVASTTEPAVWEAMAHVCIKNKRLDVAETCLANLGHVRGSKAVRDGANEPELDARVATVAVHLGLVDDAAALYEQCSRHDLLNRLYQAMGRWDDAIAVASGKDRIHLKSTHYAHGRHLESVGDVSGAIRAYEKSGCAAVDVPRMLHGRGMTDTLERYVIGAGSRELTRWWARYCESAGDYEKALHGYQAAEDYLSLVRTYCAQGDLEIAAQLVEESGDPAAAFHLARFVPTVSSSRSFPHPDVSDPRPTGAAAFFCSR